jgi:hypothetical protein
MDIILLMGAILSGIFIYVYVWVIYKNMITSILQNRQKYTKEIEKYDFIDVISEYKIDIEHNHPLDREGLWVIVSGYQSETRYELVKEFTEEQCRSEVCIEAIGELVERMTQ